MGKRAPTYVSTKGATYVFRMIINISHLSHHQDRFYSLLLTL